MSSLFNLIPITNDDKLTFKEDEEMYVLTREFYLNNFDMNFKNDKVLERRLVKNSRKVYNYIYTRSNSANRPVIDFILHKTQEGRDFLLKVLREQMEADSESGFNDLSMTPGINVMNGQVIEREKLVENQISVDTEQLIKNSAKFLGINLVYAGVYGTGIFALITSM